MFRLDNNSDLTKITIPVQPISYDDAYQLLLHMKGASNNSFMGSLGINVSYKTGPGYAPPRENWYIGFWCS